MKFLSALFRRKSNENMPDDDRQLRINGYYIERCNPFFANRKNVQIMSFYVGQDSEDQLKQNEGLGAALEMFNLQASRKFESST